MTRTEAINMIRDYYECISEEWDLEASTTEALVSLADVCLQYGDGDMTPEADQAFAAAEADIATF